MIEGMSGDLFQMGRVGILSSLSKQAKIFQDVVLSVSSNPSPVSFVLAARARDDGYGWAVGENRVRVMDRSLPYVIIHRSHHVVLSLSYCHLQASGFTLTSQVCRSMANGTIGVHGNIALGGFCRKSSGSHISNDGGSNFVLESISGSSQPHGKVKPSQQGVGEGSSSITNSANVHVHVRDDKNRLSSYPRNHRLEPVRLANQAASRIGTQKLADVGTGVSKVQVKAGFDTGEREAPINGRGI